VLGCFLLFLSSLLLPLTLDPAPLPPAGRRNFSGREKDIKWYLWVDLLGICGSINLVGKSLGR